VFELNPHSVHTLNKHKEGIYGIALDNLSIVYGMDETHNIINILKIMFSDNSMPKLRTKEWLQKMNQIMDINAEESKE
jgi:hypothetical protein